jgi:hypothetical protein
MFLYTYGTHIIVINIFMIITNAASTPTSAGMKRRSHNSAIITRLGPEFLPESGTRICFHRFYYVLVILLQDIPSRQRSVADNWNENI